MKLRILDLYCGAGGAAKGYYEAFIEAGFDVQITGVDTRPQKRYPYTFVQADALDYAASHGWAFDFIHASPPCQVHSTITPDRSRHIDLIPHTRWFLQGSGKPFVIENVSGARKALQNPIMLCGAQFGLKVYRHRFFESNVYLMAMVHIPHRDRTPSAGHGISPKGFISIAGKSGTIKGLPVGMTYMQYASHAMGIDWMVKDTVLSQAIPPAYTRFIGRQLATYFTNQQPLSIPEWRWQDHIAA